MTHQDTKLTTLPKERAPLLTGPAVRPNMGSKLSVRPTIQILVCSAYSRVKSKKYGFSRYADDLLVTAQTREDIEAIKPILADWLRISGLSFNEEKTQIVPIAHRVNFLGVHI